MGFSADGDKIMSANGFYLLIAPKVGERSTVQSRQCSNKIEIIVMMMNTRTMSDACYKSLDPKNLTTELTGADGFLAALLCQEICQDFGQALRHDSKN